MHVHPKRLSRDRLHIGQVNVFLSKSHAKSSHDGQGGPFERRASRHFLALVTFLVKFFRRFDHREPGFDLVAHPLASRGTMASVTIAQPTVRIALVARRHIDLKRVCSCICLP